MFSLKQRWAQIRNSGEKRNNLVRSNSFTLQLSPAYFGSDRNSSKKKSSRSLRHHQRYRKKKGGSSSSASSIEEVTALFPRATQQRKEPQRQHKVRYIFTAELSQRPSSLQMLQKPLNEVYLSYAQCNHSSVPGIIEVRADGLKVQYAKCDGTDIVELFNPFQTIAYWAAVQCVVKAHTSRDGRCGVHIGFFPFAENGQCLVQGDKNSSGDPTVPEGGDDGLFLWLDGTEQNMSLVQMEHPPLFACIMRQNGVSHKLQCHVFLCSSSQQAITLASNLYNNLKANLRSTYNLRFCCAATTFGSSDLNKARKQLLNEKKRRPLPSSLSSKQGPDKRTSNSLAAKDGQGTACSLCSRRCPAAYKGMAKRSGSFSQLMAGLRQMTVKEPACSTKKSKGSFKPAHSRQHSMKPSSHAHPDVDLLPGTKFSTDDILCQSIRLSGPQEALLSQSRPHWMKILLDIGLRGTVRYEACRHKGKDEDDDKKPFFNLSHLQCSSPGPARGRKPQVIAAAVQNTSNGHICSAVPKSNLGCCNKKSVNRPSKISGKSSTPSHTKIKQDGTRARSKACCKVHGLLPAETPVLVRKKANDETYAEIQETEVNCEQRNDSLTAIPTTPVESEAVAIPCTIEVDAQLDDDSLDGGDVISVASSKTERLFPVPARMCPHMANPQLVFHKFLPTSGFLDAAAAKAAATANSSSKTKKRFPGINLLRPFVGGSSALGPAEAKDSSAVLKKDAEIVSILEQIVQRPKTTAAPQCNRAPASSHQWNKPCASEVPKGGSCSDSWGWATFLP